MISCRAVLFTAVTALSLSIAVQAQPNRPECIAPSSPGGGLTCKLAQQGLQELDPLPAPMCVTHMPGGIGAVAYNSIRC